MEHVVDQRSATAASAVGLLTPQLLVAPAASGTTPTATPGGSRADLVAAEAIALVNAQRSKRGLPPFGLHETLVATAAEHSGFQADAGRLTHADAAGANAGRRLVAHGYSWATWGENLAYGYSSAADVVKAWMKSSVHKANILNSRFTDAGVAAATSTRGVVYWTLELARPA